MEYHGVLGGAEGAAALPSSPWGGAACMKGSVGEAGTGTGFVLLS